MQKKNIFIICLRRLSYIKEYDVTGKLFDILYRRSAKFITAMEGGRKQDDMYNFGKRYSLMA